MPAEKTTSEHLEECTDEMSTEPIEGGYSVVNTSGWERHRLQAAMGPNKDHDALWGTTVRLDVTKARQVCKAEGWKYLHASLYLMALAINKIESLGYRIRRDSDNCDGNPFVIQHKRVHASCPIMRKHNETFGFCLFESQPQVQPSFAAFRKFAHRAMHKFHHGTDGLNKLARDDMFHGSILPWIDFTSYQHAVGSLSRADIPKYVFGKLVKSEEDGRWSQAFCLHVHHALVPSKDVSDFVNTFQRQLDQAEDLLLT